jgi:2-desacetyl-2-hydroxyethyl bacteriochlorophyllide A dehydrogenase
MAEVLSDMGGRNLDALRIQRGAPRSNDGRERCDRRRRRGEGLYGLLVRRGERTEHSAAYRHGGSTVKAGVWLGEGKFECNEWNPPTVPHGKVLVHVEYCGFCGSDGHIIQGTLQIGRPPRVLGHEVSGVVAEVGEGVKGMEIGRRVACNLYGYCGACTWCAEGLPNHCLRKYFSANGFAEYALYGPGQLFELPDNVGLIEGALVEPIATCLHAAEVGAIRPGETVLVVGGGTLGQIIAQIARRAGASTVVLSEPEEWKRNLAVSLGSHDAVPADETALREIAARISPRGGFDVIFDAAGSLEAAELAPELAAVGGRLVIVGVYGREQRVALSPYAFYERELSMKGSFAALHTFPRAIGILHELDLQPLITAIVPLADVGEAYRRHREGSVVKVMVRCGDADA